jgi:pyruvate,water dikinase
MINSAVFSFQEIDATKLSMVGGKGANLGELSRIEGIKVPEGFCISTEVFKRIIGNTSSVNKLLDELSHLKLEDRTQINKLSSEIRRIIERIAIPQDIIEEIDRNLSRFNKKDAFAVRSSATGEDLPTASFAGQQDTYLNNIGKKAILKHISKCWASLFTDRAVIYRIQNGFDHSQVYLSVIVQRMVFPESSGILFTADPMTSNRKVLSIDASFGLGEALVSGIVDADNYKVREGRIIDKKIPTKKLFMYATKDGGTKQQELEPERQNMQALKDKHILQLERMGRKIEAHFGRPQDIEWCLADDTFYIVQSRPITTLYPIPEHPDSHKETQENHVYLSVGHQQMMTDAMKPLGLSFWLLSTPASMHTAGGRLFVDVAPMLASPAGRQTIIETLGKFDPFMKGALSTIVQRGDFIKSLPDDKKEPGTGKSDKAVSPPNYLALNDYDPTIVSDLIRSSQTSLEAVKQIIQ